MGFLVLITLAFFSEEHRKLLDEASNGCKWMALAYCLVMMDTSRYAPEPFLSLPHILA